MNFDKFFKKGTKKNKIKNIFMVIAPLVLLYMAFVLFLTSLMMCVDFPCIVGIEDNYLLGTFPDIEETKHAEVFITGTPAHATGGGCYHKSLENNESVSIHGISFRVRDDKIIVQGEEININQSWSNHKYKFNILAPWYIYKDHINLNNRGFVSGYADKNDNMTEFENEILVITGTEGTDEIFNYLTLIIFVLISITLFACVVGSLRRESYPPKS